MWLEATLTRDELKSFLVRLLPLEIRLGESGRLLLLRGPLAVSFVADRGVEVVCEAKLRWSVLGVHVPMTIHALASSIQPPVEQRPEGHTVVFKLEIDRTGLTGLPLVDDHVAARDASRAARAHHGARDPERVEPRTTRAGVAPDAPT